MKGITRFEGYDKTPDGWDVRLFWNDQQPSFQKFFSDNNFGGPEKSLEAAKKYRNDILHLIESFRKLPFSKKTKLPGIFLRKVKNYFTFRIFLGGRKNRIVKSKGFSERGMYETFKECYMIRREWELERYGGTLLSDREEEIEKMFENYVKFGRKKYKEDFEEYYSKYP